MSHEGGGMAEAVGRLREAAGATKCWSCGCLHDTLAAVVRAVPEGQRPPQLDAALRRGMDRLKLKKQGVESPMANTSEQIKADIKQRFVKLALRPQEEQKFPVGPASAKRLGYESQAIDALPGSVTESFAGVGNPLALGELRPGQTVLDLGSGAGLDSILAAGKVGPAGKVIGVDFAAEMIEKAKRNAEAVGLSNAEFRQGEADALPVEDGSVDVLISNGVFNLCPDKPKVLAEARRALRPGGRLQMADILLEDGVTPEEVAKKGTWSD